MPFLDASPPADAPVEKWRVAIKNALSQRRSADSLEKPFRQLDARYPISAEEVAKVVLSFRAPHTGWDDILIFRYVKPLLRLRLTTSSYVLSTLLDTSPISKKPAPEGLGPSATSQPPCEDLMFSAVTQLYISGELELLPWEVHHLTHTLTRWLKAISDYETGKQLEAGALHSLDPYTFATYESIASLAITVFSSHNFRQATKQPWWRKRRDTVVRYMQDFDDHVLVWMRSQVAGRLQALTTSPAFIKTDAKGFPVFTDEQILGNIADLPTMNCRAGLFVWLNACLCARPLTDDLAIVTYLQARFPANSQSMTTDLLIASFDVLTNSLLRTESDPQVHLIRSFICNKLPHLFSIFSAMLSAGTSMEVCINLAFTAISIEAAPPITTGANEMREKLKSTRLEFLQACALHGLVTESTISSIVREQISLPRVTKYTKEGLLAQCNNNVARLEPLVDELDNMTGNAGAIAGCFVDTINNLCMNRDTIALKAVCAMLIRKTSTLDIILQYTQPANLLLPLCNQLNGWTHDQDQTEFTPAYEEFASILLIVLVAVHRYDLSRADLGLPNDGNFMALLLQNMAVARDLAELTEEQHNQLKKWAEGLFAADEAGETGGISDDVMRQCPPQAFYQLVPTLFAQTVLARKTGDLPAKPFSGGLELLVEPFLLPCLVGGLKWLINHSWADHNDAIILLQALDKLLKPSSSSQETKVMHRSILRIVADDLYNSLQALQQRQPEKKQVVPLMNILKPYLGQKRSMDANKAQLANWSSPDNGGCAEGMRIQVRGLVGWVADNGPPPKYTHRRFASACVTIGVQRMRDVLVEELKEQTKLGNGPQALDICSAMICAAVASLNPAAAKVRDILRLIATDAQGLLKLKTDIAEAIVRLSRRVETQLAVAQMPQVAMSLPMPDQATDQVMAELGLTDDALAATVTNDVPMDQVPPMDNVALNSVLDQAMNVDSTGVQGMPDLPVGEAEAQNIFGDLGLDLNQDPQQLLGATDNAQQNAEEDIFAGLDMNLEDDFNFS